MRLMWRIIYAMMVCAFWAWCIVSILLLIPMLIVSLFVNQTYVIAPSMSLSRDIADAIDGSIMDMKYRRYPRFIDRCGKNTR